MDSAERLRPASSFMLREHQGSCKREVSQASNCDADKVDHEVPIPVTGQGKQKEEYGLSQRQANETNDQERRVGAPMSARRAPERETPVQRIVERRRCEKGKCNRNVWV